MLSYGNVSRFAIGPLVGKIWNNMQDVMNGDSDAKLFRLISGHDMGPLIPLLCTYPPINPSIQLAVRSPALFCADTGGCIAARRFQD